MEAAREMELPELHGSEKQIAWAVTLRQNKIEEFEKYREEIVESRNCRANAKNVFNIISTAKDIEKAIEEVEELFQVTLTSLTSATSWINTRFDSIEEILQKQKDNIKIAEEKEIEKEIEKEGIVSSENTKYKGYVFIDKQENIIFAVYEKNEEFINIIKSYLSHGQVVDGKERLISFLVLRKIVWQKQETDYSKLDLVYPYWMKKYGMQAVQRRIQSRMQKMGKME